MNTRATVDDVFRLAQELIPLEKREVVGRIESELKVLLITDPADDQYQQGYERQPEDVSR